MDEVVEKACRMALEKFGLDKQIIKCIEELSELQKELCKKLWGQGSREHIVEELIDTEIMLEQIKIGMDLSFYELASMKARKIERLNERLKGD